MNSNRMGGHRTEALAATITRELQAELARGLADPRIRGLITITGVKINTETRTARALVSVMPEEHESLTMHGLNAAARHLRRRVADRIRTRDMPLFEFAVDEQFKRESATLRAIAEANREHDEAAESPAPATEAPDASENPPRQEPER